MSSKPNTRVTLVGAGPGDPDLLTLKGLKALRAADAVLYDALSSRELLSEVPPDAPRIFVGKRRGYKIWTQEAINALLVETALRRGHVIRLKGGDPFIFGRGYEEMEYVSAHGIPCEYIPGVSSAFGVPGIAGIPPTHRNLSRSVWVITATCSDGSLSPDLPLAVHSEATIVVLMGGAKISQVAELFRTAGKANLPAAVIRNGTLPEQQIIRGTVRDIAEKCLQNPSAAPTLLVFGAVAGLPTLSLTDLPIQQEQIISLEP